VLGGALDLRDLGELPVADLLAVVELHLLHEPEVLVRLHAREHGDHGRRAQRVRRDVEVVARAEAGQQLAVDLLLVGDADVVGHRDGGQAVLERLVLLVGHEGPELGLVRVGQDDRVGVDVAELGDLELLLLGHRQEEVPELGGVLEELDGLEQAAVGLRELAGPVERQRVRVRPVRLDGAEVEAAGELLDAHRLGVAGLERADADAPRLREVDPLDREVQEVQRLLVHRAAVQRVHGALVGRRPLLEAALEQRGDRALGAAGRPPEQQDPPAGLVALGGGLEVADDALERHVEAEELLGEEPVGDLAGMQTVRVARRLDHVVNPLVRACRDRLALRHPIDVLVEGDELGGLGRALLRSVRQCLLEIHLAPLRRVRPDRGPRALGTSFGRLSAGSMARCQN
jgi:hypothetical protein